MLEHLATGQPALTRAEKIQKAVSKVGFDWADSGAVLAKIKEEVAEITQSFLSTEIGNAATHLVRKYGNDAADTRALNQYIQLARTEQLKSTHG